MICKFILLFYVVKTVIKFLLLYLGLMIKINYKSKLLNMHYLQSICISTCIAEELE